MKKVTAYKCDHCPKTSTNAGAMAQHERRCVCNPNNEHKCFDYCKHLALIYVDDRKCFVCKVTNVKMYSYKIEHRGFKLDGLTRMPLKCDKHEYRYFD